MVNLHLEQVSLNSLRTRLITALMLAALAVGSALAEAPPTNQDHDVIVLKNGGVARGRILDTVEGSHLVLEIANGKTIRIQLDDVDFITNNDVYIPPTPIIPPSGDDDDYYVLGPSGPRFLSHVTVLSGENTTNFGAGLQLGSFIQSQAMVAIGVQMDWYSINVLSLRLNLYAFSKAIPPDMTSFSLFLHLGTGYGHVVSGPPHDVDAGGANMSVGAGLMIPTQLGSAVILEFGLHHQRIAGADRFHDEGTMASFSMGIWF